MNRIHLILSLLVMANGQLYALTTAPILANPLIGSIGLDFDNNGNSEMNFYDRARLTTGSNTGFWHQHKEFVGFVESNIEIAINVNEDLIFSNPPLDSLVFVVGVVPHRFEIGDSIDETFENGIYWSDIQRYNGLRIFEYEIGSEIDRTPIIENPSSKGGIIDLGELWQESGYIGFRQQSGSGEFSYGFLEIDLDYDSALFGLTGYAITDGPGLTVTAIPESSTCLIFVAVCLCVLATRRKEKL